jgi:lysophospholipase L1-like esterase
VQDLSDLPIDTSPRRTYIFVFFAEDFLRRVLKHFAVSSISVCITLVLLEAGIRIVNPQDLSYWDSSAFRGVRSTSPHFVENIPYGKANFIGVPVAINGLGLRDDNETSFPKPPHTVRIVAVGDSITFGYGIPLQKTYAKTLEGLLNENMVAGTRYEVLNGGTLGGSLSDYLHFLADKANAIRPDVVIIGICLNDIGIYFDSGSFLDASDQQWRNGRRWTHRFNHFLLRHSELYMFCYTRLKSLFYSSGILDIAKVGGMDFGVLAPQHENQERAWTDSLAMLSRIVALCRERGYKLMLVVFPVQMQLSAAELQFYREKFRLRLSDCILAGEPQRRLRDYADAMGLTLVDLLPVFHNYNYKGLYIHNDRIPADPTHLSIEGNQIAAAEIFRVLQKTAILRLAKF